MTKYMKLLCSNCSNPESPEFRDFEMVGNQLLCTMCGRQLKLVDSDEDNHYEFEVIHEGQTHC